MSMRIVPPLPVAAEPDVSALTTLEAWIGIRTRAKEWREADDVFVAAQGESAQWDALEDGDTASVGLYCLLDLLEERGILAEIETYLAVTYGRV